MKQARLLTIIFSLILLFNGPEATGQSYHPMPVSDALWSIARCWYFYPGGWHDDYVVELDGSDTIYNGRVYKKLNLFTHHAPGTGFDSVYVNFLGGMREADKQVFFVSEYLCLDTIERMLYDFNPTFAGDTIYTQVLTNGLTQFIPHIVISIDSVLVSNEYHVRINLRDENEYFFESWIEGVGSTQGLIYPSYWLLTDNSYDLKCFYHQNQLGYYNPSPGYSFCTPPIPVHVCGPLSSIDPQVSNHYHFNIYPNPASDFLNIESTNDFRAINILNGWGEKVVATGFTTQLEIHSLPSGFYFIQFLGPNNQILNNLKFIKM